MEIEAGIYTELYSLGYAFLYGAALALLYDLFRIARRILPRGTFWVSIEDMIYFAFASFAVFSFFFVVNYGRIRTFLVVGIALGALIYHLLIGRGLILLVSRLIVWVKKELKNLKNAVTIMLK